MQKRPHRQDKPKSEYEQKTLEIRRVTRVVEGGKRFSFRASVVLGNMKGKVGFGTGKGGDVALAIEKAAEALEADIARCEAWHVANGSYEQACS